jgi:NAD(P)-dependent dehydrogenase (short-subunit alcohol dehydrogenase family)
MRRLDGKVAVVTGASSGFGRAIARAFAGEDAKVVVSDIRDEPLPGGFEDDLDTTTVQAIEADGGTAIYVNCDVTKPAQVHDDRGDGQRVRAPRHPHKQRRHLPRRQAHARVHR